MTFENNTGFVGIGANPEEKLHVTGNLKLHSTGHKIYWDWPGRAIEQYSSDGGPSRMIRFTNSMDHSNTDGGFDFTNNYGVSVMRINDMKVGIGTGSTIGQGANPAPNLKLQIDGDLTVESGHVISLDQNYYNHAYMKYSSAINKARYELYGYYGFRFVDNGGTRMVVEQGGNVGIGTTTPSARLDVVAPNGSVNSFRVGRLDNSNYWGVNHAGNDFRLYNSASSGSDILFGVDPGGGIKDNKVGIGTATPVSKLDVNGRMTLSGNTENQIYQATQSIANAQTTNTTIVTGRQIDLYAYDDVVLRAGTSDDIRFIAGGSERMLIDKNGKVGIGTTSTGPHKLAIEGSMGAREVKVQASGWSDFVFEDNYDLPTLKEVEKYIEEKGHLKDIPSAKEVAENGILLGQMDSKLLQKIEELTLYAIQQQKTIDGLKAEVSDVKKENQTLKTVLQKLQGLQKEVDALKEKK